MSRLSLRVKSGNIPALCVLLLGLMCRGPAFAGAELKLYETRLQPLPDIQYFEGRVEAIHRATVSAQTTGEVIELPFDVNDFVPKGELIVRLDDTRQKAELEKAVATEAEAAARLVEAESVHSRNLRLIKENAASKSQVDRSAADLKSARAQLKAARAALEQAREQWEYTSVEAPYDGVLVERLVELGEQVQVGTRLGTGLSLEKLRIKAEVPAAFADRVRTSALARVATEDGAWIESDKLTFFPYADPQSHTFTVRVDLPEGQYGLYPGMLAKVGFQIGESDYLTVPDQTIVHRSEVTGVYVQAADGGVHFRQLRLGHRVPGGHTVVLAGLQAGERIALDPVAAAITLKQQRSGASDE